MKTRTILALVVALLMLTGTSSMAMAASVTPTLYSPWTSGDAASELGRIGCTAPYAYKVEPWDTGDPSGDYTHAGNTIHIAAHMDDGEYKSFDWTSVYPVYCVIVKASTKAYVYSYPGGSYGDTNLVAPDGKAISHVTFGFGDPETCYRPETAWAVGSRYVSKGNWAMYVACPASGPIQVRAAGGNGVGMEAGTVTLTPNGSNVDITINLTDGFIFYYDLKDTLEDHNIKVQGYTTTPPARNPNPGGFANKAMAPVGATSYTITVPQAAFYGIHLDVAYPVPCQ